MIIDRITTLYEFLVRAASNCQSALLLAIRLFWGWQFFQTGWGKLQNLETTAEFFASLGIPFPELNAMLAGATECFGGLFLLAGLASRLVAIPLVVTMIVAYVTADWEALLGILSEPDKFVSADPFLFMFASAIILIFGPGKASLDHAIACWVRRGKVASAGSAGTAGLHGAPSAG